ncbi:MAG TPA: N-6 DNA methylase, partial [Candidatus Kapabacteria bacterium]|nr:N-6 DNA methylase [Candidatus Kapabacteria bacterium]
MNKNDKLTQLYRNLELSRDNGLIEVKGHTNWEKRIPEEIALSFKIKKQLDILQPDAFYHFHEAPLILFYDNPADEDIPRIHRQVWCFNRTPVVFITRDTCIDVYNAFHYEDGSLKKLNIDEADIRTRFSFWELRSGNTWKWIEDTFFKGRIKKYRVDKCLLNNIRSAVSKLENEGIPLKTANVIILRLIFIRYLIDRGVIIDEKFIEGNSSEKERRKESFNHLIPDKERLYLFFDHLKERFNGNLFEMHGDEAMIKQVHLELLSMLFRGHLETGERFLFDVYDFSIIPIELISGIYESITDDNKRKENAAIYTPTFLVDFILRQTVEPYLEDNDAKACKVLDPACGSGIFLVEAY